MSIGVRLAELVREEIRLAGGAAPATIEPSTILAETGLDSLGFATIVVTLNKELGVDPFGGDLMVYPESFGELVELYEVEQARKAEAHG